MLSNTEEQKGLSGEGNGTVGARADMIRKIFLFPDTNLFIQCKPPHELDWSQWQSYDEVNLLVSRPVQAEIDSQKGTGGARLARRARSTSTLFRNILLSDEGYLEVRSACPVVRIYLRPDLKRDETLSGRLDYNERDDQLVGIAALFEKNTPEACVSILTHDTGPMSSAKMIGVEFKVIPDSWLLPPETDSTQKELNSLRAENDRLKKAEPVIKARFENVEAGKAVLFYIPLSEDEVRALVGRLASHFPLQTDFGSRQAEERHNKSPLSNFTPFFDETEVFTPATGEEISHYMNECYPTWRRKCEASLRNLHEQLNADICWPTVTVWLLNQGSRPAEHTQVTVSACGDFQIQPLEENKSEEQKPALTLPRPPKVPKGKWVKHSRGDAIKSLFEVWQGPYTTSLPKISVPYIPHITRRDPNLFYYQAKPQTPVKSYQLTCVQWRHQNEEEPFRLAVHFELESRTISGAIEVNIQASNVANPVIDHQPITIMCKGISSFERADELVTMLIKEGE